METLKHKNPAFKSPNFTLLLLDCIQVKMVTGDQHAIAVETSKRLGLGTNIMEGASLLQNNDFEKLCIEVREALWLYILDLNIEGSAAEV